MTSEAVWYGAVERRLFGWLDHPDGGAASVGVLLCPPIGAEAIAAHRALRRLALQLAAAGFSVLRPDYDGTGDSAGDANDPDRVGAWVDSVAAAAALLSAAGATRICAVGMRLGANLAAAVAERVPLEALVLWDPCASGASFMREQLALSGQIGGDSRDGAIDAPDRYYAAATAEQIRTALPPLRVPAGVGQALALVRSDRPVPKALRAALTAPAVEWGDAVGQHALIGVPVEAAVLPDEAIGEIVAWLRRVAVPPPARAPGGPPSAPVAASCAQLTLPSGRRLTERGVRLGPAGLFGVAAEPEHATSDTVVVFVNVANERHLGPDRGWVRLARELAGEGLRSVRLDLSGVGDSPSHPGQERDVVYARQWLTDLPDVVEALAPAPVVLVGLCSGAYSAIECALSSRVRAVCAINPVLDIDWLARPSRLWCEDRRALRVMPGPLRRLAVRHQRVADWTWRALREAIAWREPAEVLARVVRRDTDVLLIVSPQDAHAFRRTLLWRAVGLPWLERTGRLRFEVLDTLDHAVDRVAGREAALKAIATHVVDRCSGPAATPSAAALRHGVPLASVVSPPAEELP